MLGIPGKFGILGRFDILGMLGMLSVLDMFGTLGRLKGRSEELVSADGAVKSPVIVRCKCSDGEDPRRPAPVGIPVSGSRSGKG